ncbi:hypothetical protein J5N97_000236 [Dioscorea zingiberensis]|uniref:Uncharacterized protein n=1 Tax=Dioscorea zingiberensis TaxID=325984 RepID=A0A9D5BSW9_9LILI|nr:hypothetical protein J5N97_000236 [Dioscorea zingiberensis]
MFSIKHYQSSMWERDSHFHRSYLSLDKPKVSDALHLFKQPHRVTRPDHFVIILRGLPGSGKELLSKAAMRDLEVEKWWWCSLIHSMDDYFMTEVEKVEENDASKSSSSPRGKKPVVKKVMEYCYEPEMQEMQYYLEIDPFGGGMCSFALVDDRNLRVAEFAQFWAIAKVDMDTEDADNDVTSEACERESRRRPWNLLLKTMCLMVGNTGFSIAAAKKANVSSLVIGPGAGYNLKSNPLPEEENPVATRSTAKPKRQNVFQDQLHVQNTNPSKLFLTGGDIEIGGLDLEDE